MASKVGKLIAKNSALFLCDMQEKFRPTIQYFPQIVTVAARMLNGAKVLEMPVIVTEQYPKGLGHTVPELDVSGYKVFDKTQFSMMLPEVKKELQKTPNVNTVLICGIEAHACVQGTVLDLVDEGFDVHVIVDACSSRSMVDRMYALERMKSVGAHLTTSEGAILGLAQGSAHPRFREIQKIIWDSAPDSGLLTGMPQEGTPV